MSKQTTLFGFTQPCKKSAEVSKDERYDQTKRKRKFQKSWRERFPWVEVEVQSHPSGSTSSDADVGDSMYCIYCKTFPECANKSSALFKGTGNFRIDPHISHDQTSEHFVASKRYFTKNKICDQNNNGPGLRKNTDEPCSSSAIEKYREKLLPAVSSTEIAKAMYRISDEEKEKMTVLFNTAYAVAKNGKPYRDYLYLYELNKFNGLDFGGQYNNIHACENFIEAIGQTYREKIRDEILKTNCVSILADGSTDAAVLEQEIVYLRYVQPYSGVPVCRQIDIVAVQSPDATGILAALHQAVEKGLNVNMSDLHPNHKMTPSLIMANFDGASVNFGSKSGVVVKLKEDFPELLSLQCVAHKLELPILDAVKSWKYLSDFFEEVIKGIFKFYHYSPKRRRELKAISEILEKDLVHFSSVKQVRCFASKSTALDAVKKKLEQVVTHVEQNNLSSKSTDSSSKALGYVKKIKTVKFVKVLHFMLDFLPIVAEMSKAFQSESVLLFKVPILIQGVILALESLKTNPGTHMKEFLDMFDSETCKYGNVKLTNKPQNLTYTDDHEVTKFLSDVITYVTKRFETLYEPPFSYFSIFNVKNWPVLVPELGQYGVSELMSIVDHECFSFLFTEEEKSVMVSQWSLLKAKVRHLRHVPLNDIFSSVIAENRQSGTTQLGAVCKVIEVMMTLSPSTVSCERGFSIQNILKTDKRTRLTQNNLRNQLLLMTEGPPVSEFIAEECISKWLLSTSKGRHVNGHTLKCKNRESDPHEMYNYYDVNKF